MLKLAVCIIVLTAVCSAQEIIGLIQDQLDSLSQEVEALKNQSRENRQLAVGALIKELYVPPHVYIYRLTPASQSWQQSQEFCRNWGGTLAVHGVKTRENRKTLIQNLWINNFFWIGLNDIASEGNWVWVNGERASSSELIWRSGQPNGGRNANCVRVYGYPPSSNDGLASFFVSFYAELAYDASCARSYPGLCEKQI